MQVSSVNRKVLCLKSISIDKVDYLCKCMHKGSMSKAGSVRCKNSGLMLTKIRKVSHAEYTQVLQSCWKPQLPIMYFEYHKQKQKILKL